MPLKHFVISPYPPHSCTAVSEMPNFAATSRVLSGGRDKLGLELAQLSDRQRPFEFQCASSPAGQTHMGGDLLRFDQCHAIDQQAHDAFALTEVDARVVPESSQLLGKTENALVGLRAECRSRLPAARSHPSTASV